MGGIPQKSPYAIQTLSNVLDMPVKTTKSEHACALGAAICAATASGIYGSIEEAKGVMASGFDQHYLPEKRKSKVYKNLYKKYYWLGNAYYAITPGQTPQLNKKKQ